jgi:hypothetical protein
MEVWRRMIPVIHLDHDAIKTGEFRHAWGCAEDWEKPLPLSFR